MIHVDSPQFHTKWSYEYDTVTSHIAPSADNQTVNPFVEKTLRVCLLYIQPPPNPRPAVIHITIQADNDFYSVLPHLPSSQDGVVERTPDVVAGLPKFLKCPVDDDGRAIVNKTGLGSSAALTTSLVGSLLYAFHQKQEDGDESTTNMNGIVHNLAQICHCYAQGKVGSGFDVSSACHGTHVYRCFPKCLLPDLLQQLEKQNEGSANPSSPDLVETLRRVVDLVPWKDDMVRPLSLPRGQLQILLADVRGGSESPSMARNVLKWKADNTSEGGDVPYWTALSELNAKVIALIQQLPSQMTSERYDTLAAVPAAEWPKDVVLTDLYETFREVRTNLRSMGEAAGVPIEPPAQTALCDATMALPGVVTALVPGAGGYDAVVCLYIDRPAVRESIGRLWAGWKEPVICPLAVQASDTGLQLEDWQ
jgi:phosphomevalonate kinase